VAPEYCDRAELEVDVEPEAAVGTEQAREDRPRHVLIVEDHELLAESLALALRREGLEVTVATGPTAEAVLETGKRLRPAVTLLDLNLGDELGTGLALVAPLAAGGSRVVMCTGTTDRLELARCVEAGAIGLASKRDAFDGLLEMVRGALAGEQLIAPGERQELLAELHRHRLAERDRLAPFQALTRREEAVLELLIEGNSAEAIAAKSFVSLATVRSQIRSILQKLNVNTQLAAVALARRHGWRAEVG
jgi:DNA-binding NarL/FixJ family response regulator